MATNTGCGKDRCSRPSREEVTDMSVHPQELVIIDIWTVAPGRQQEMADALRAGLERLRLIDGFIEGDVLAN